MLYIQIIAKQEYGQRQQIIKTNNKNKGGKNGIYTKTYFIL